MKEGQLRQQRKRFVNGDEAQAFIDSGSAGKGVFIFGSEGIQFIGEVEETILPKPADAKLRFNSDPTHDAQMQRSAQNWFTRRFGVID